MVIRPPAGRLVLIVDDYQDCRDMYAACLGLAGFSVIKAADGLEAISIARRALPDLILMDLGLPVVDGVEATRRLKCDVVTRGIPVVALTAQSVPDAERLRAAGFESVIIKPCLPDDLAQRVGAALARASAAS
jgi:CheY-like chemotaxis protein